MLKTLNVDGRPVLLIVGGDPIGTLYGAYRFAEHLGVRFYMHGDVVPDGRVALELPVLDETRKPLFDRRGIQPFHDFPEGPDWWNRDGYKAILGQLPKMGMNFFGLHTYPEGGVGPEPLVWIGPPDELLPDGKVKASYPSRHFTTSNTPPAWGYQPGNTANLSLAPPSCSTATTMAPTTCAARIRGRRCRPSSATPCSSGWASASATCSPSPSGWA